MKPADIKSAIAYNKKQGYSDTEIGMIQKVVGSKPDGSWGPKTVEAVYEWQGRRQVTQDGKVGPQTWAEVQKEYEDEPSQLAKPSSGCKPIHGVWLDGPKKRFMKLEAWQEMKDHGITSVAVMVETSRRAFDPKYTLAEITQMCEWAEQLGMHVGITDWPFPDTDWMEKAEEILTPWFEQLPLHYSESDVEGNWLRNKVKGYKNIDEAGDALVAFKQRLTAAAMYEHCRFETTTYTSHTENGRAADVAPHCDMIFGQAYSVRNRSKKNPVTKKYDVPWSVPWTHIYGPGNMQKTTLDRSLQVPDCPTKPMLGAGLAGYDQKWPGKSAMEAMSTAYQAALMYDPREVRWWSYKWIFGHLDTSYGRPFFLSVM